METQTTTTEQAAAPAAQPSPTEGISDGADALDARASALLEQLSTEQKTAARDAQVAETTAPADETTKTEAAPAEVQTPDAIAEARRARIAAREAELQRMAEEERAKVEASRAKKQPAAPEAPPPAQGIQITDAASFFAAAEKLAIPPQDLAAWLTGQQDPSKVAEASAKKALTPVEQKLKELEDQVIRFQRQQEEAAQAAQVAQLVEQNHKLILSRLDEVKAEAPLAAAFAAKKPAKYRQAVESICNGLPPGFTAQDVIDQLEENLLDLQLSGSSLASPSANSTTKPAPKPAAAKANVGNRLAAERATTVEDDGDDADGDLEARAQRLKARLAAAG